MREEEEALSGHAKEKFGAGRGKKQDDREKEEEEKEEELPREGGSLQFGAACANVRQVREPESIDPFTKSVNTFRLANPKASIL